MQISNNIASLQTNQNFLNKSAQNLANMNSGSEAQKSQSDLAKEIPNQIIAQDVQSANVTAIKAQDDVLGTLLDIKA